MRYNKKKVVDEIWDFERGEIVVVMDEEGREKEGDMIVEEVNWKKEKMELIVRNK